MSEFDYHRPGTLVEASEMLQEDGAVALAGGTDLLVAIRHRQKRPTLVVDLKSVEDLEADIQVVGGHLRIGGRVVMSSLTNAEAVVTRFPALAEAASKVGSIQIRNRATLAGNLCNASPAADTAPPLLAYGATVEIAGQERSRSVSLGEFLVGPGQTALDPGEMVTAIEIPLPDSPTGSAFGRVTRRRGVDLASVNLACVVQSSGRVRFGFGAVAPTVVLAESTLDDLEDETGWSHLFRGTSPISDVRAGADYRRAMLEVHSRRVLQQAISRMEGS